MKYAVEMCSGAMIYIPSFIKTGFGIQRWNWGVGKHTYSTVIKRAYINFFKK
jgi:hypothetical protein